MNTWAVPGAKCVCIKDEWGGWTFDGLSIPTRVPMLHEVLTVAAVNADGPMLYLSFHEIPLHQEDSRGARKIFGDVWWNVEYFRPLNQRRTDISIFKKLLAPAPKVREPA